MSSNRFKNSGLNTRFDSSRILSRIASYDLWSTTVPKPSAVWRLISSAPTFEWMCCNFVVKSKVGVDDRHFSSSPRTDRE
jgi:hypothetical protein